jgi:hypothetical protein
MKKALIVSSIAVLAFLMFFHFSKAAFGAGSKPFGGKIIDEESIRITTLEASGFACVVPGDTFDIKSVYGPTGPYLIPAGVTARGGGAAFPGRWVMGLYGLSKTAITCTNEATGATVIVYANPITIFGVSKF